ncbi:hypothetical protein [Pararhizobium sp. A13]|uniref:hypothetical protein n=1 Tax=Pararhizobium sp. A13 TaxID=3133975 RepID=UPI00311B2BE7
MEVKNPPALVAQATGAWCFAAAEVMVRSYRNLPAMSQYAIARRNLLSLAELDPAVQEQWETAQALDASATPPRQENGGANMESAVVQLVRSEYNAFDNASTGGQFMQLSAATVLAEIENNRIFVVGTSIHYYVVYGCNVDGTTLLVRDPWPAGQGGLATEISLAVLLNTVGHVAISFTG